MYWNPCSRGWRPITRSLLAAGLLAGAASAHADTVFTTNPFSGSNTTDVTANGSYSLTTVTRQGGTDITSLNAGQRVPEPDTLVLLTMGLASLVLLRRRTAA